MSKRQVLFTLPRASASLYNVAAGSVTRAWPWGTADLNSPVFVGADASGFRSIQRFDEVAMRPTGSFFPVVKHIPTEVSLEFRRVMLAEVDGSQPNEWPTFEIITNQPYVLDLIWREENTPEGSQQAWARRTFYGVRFSEDVIESSMDEVAFMQSNPIRAAFFASSSGLGDVPSL